MKRTSKISARSARSARTRAMWQSHIIAQQASGKTQVAYCREYQLNEQYFSIWKRKLRGESSAVSAVPEAPALIPVSVQSDFRQSLPGFPQAGSGEPYTLRITLCNGIGVECVMPSVQALLPVLSQLAQLPC
jgi:hypothetical protein